MFCECCARLQNKKCVACARVYVETSGGVSFESLARCFMHSLIVNVVPSGAGAISLGVRGVSLV